MENLFATFSLVILAQHVLGQCANDTRPMHLNASGFPNWVYSPNYPNSYPPNASCAWLIEAPSIFDKIIINIESFKSQIGENLTMYEGTDTLGTLVWAVDEQNHETHNVYVSSGNVLYLTFITDANEENDGFQILYFSNDTAAQPDCGSTLDISPLEQVLMSPNLPDPYTGAESCDWYFNSSTDGIKFVIRLLDMGSCDPEFLTIYDGLDNSSEVLAQRCETAERYQYPAYVTSGSSAYIHWNVSTEASSFYGFLLTFQVNVSGSILGSSCSTTSQCSNVLPYSECSSSICTCSRGYIESSDECILVIGMPCTTTGQCSSVMSSTECVNDVCVCKKGYRNVTTGCTKVASSGCHTSSDCTEFLTNSECSNSKCRCSSGYAEDNGICSVGVSGSCTSSTECVSHASCTGGTCSCNEGYKSRNNLCQKILGGSCYYTIDCTRYDSNSNCILGQCMCNEGFIESSTFCLNDCPNLVSGCCLFVSFALLLIQTLIGET